MTEPTSNGYFGETVADDYDEALYEMFDQAVVEPAVDLLAELAGDGRVLELGVGTGRIALPLAARGIDVHGVDLSRPMIARLHAKPGADRVGVTVGDFATTRVEGPFRLVYLVFNTIMNVTTQDGQVAVFRNAATHLEAGGHFVIEVGVPALRRLPPGEQFVVFDAGDRHWGVDEYDVANQGLISHHFQHLAGEPGDRFRLSSAPFRYVWPAELDLMARLAGMELRHRWSGWRSEPFTSESTTHVSVWQKP
jgi:SAM-dependent methyltransferase